MRRIEAWAEKSKLHSILSFIEQFEYKLDVPRPLLLGSNGQKKITIQGMATRHQFNKLISHLDEPFNPDCFLEKPSFFVKHHQNFKPEIFGSMHNVLQKGFKKVCFFETSGQCKGGVIYSHSI